MAVGQQDRRAVGAHDHAGRARGVVGNIVFLQGLVVDGERAARQDRQIFACGGDIEDLLAGGQAAELRAVIADSQDSIAVARLIEVHHKCQTAAAVGGVVLEVRLAVGEAAEQVPVQIVEAERILGQHAELAVGHEVQVVDHGVADGDGAGDLLRVGPEEDDGGFKHAILLAEDRRGGVF